MQRIHSCAAAALIAVTLSARGQFQDVFLIGTDNSQGIEFEVQTATLVDYYWENGNYTGAGLAGLNWINGMEPWDNAVANDTLGFPRALTQAGGANPQTNIFFNLDANESTAGQPIRITVDLVSPMVNTTHDIDLRVNGNAPFASRTAINSSQLWTIDTTAGAMGAVTGPNVLRIRRTGGTLSGGVATIQFDHVRLQADITPQYIQTFTTNDTVLRPGEVATLTWVLYQPAATVSIDQGIGDVTGLTTGGTGSINVTPAVNTTYTLSATFGGLTQARQLAITASPWSALFEAGTDNGAYADFSHDLAADDDYYFAGNYTSVGGPNQVANEVMNDDTNTETVAGRTGSPAIGFERTIRESDPHQNIWYVAPPALNDPSARLRVSCDLWRIGSTGTPGNGTHILEFSSNGNVIRTESNITTPRLVQFETTGVSAGYAPGPNKLTVRRIGGTLAGFVDLDYINLEYMVGTPPVITGITDDSVLGTHKLAWTATTGKTYRVQKSTDGGTSWSDLGVGFPRGGAKGTALFFEDRDTPWANPRPSYRILLE